MREDFISAYVAYTEGNEVPALYHRWCCISMLGALLGREYSIPFGHSAYYPNQFIMLIGISGTRKSTAIKISNELLSCAGYNFFSANRTTKEAFLIDLQGEEADTLDDIVDSNIFGGLGSSDNYKQMYIACDEFNNFIGINNILFVSLLGELWDHNGIFKDKVKNGKSVIINNPTVSILGGNTPTNFQTAFPPAMLGQGFFSRLLLIYGKPTGRKITYPRVPSLEDKQFLIDWLIRIRNTVKGQSKLTDEAKELIHKIYNTRKQMEDVRFEAYDSRRLGHLLKLCLIVSAARVSTEIDAQDVVYANSILTYTEHLMPRALGEFGLSRHSAVTHKIVQFLENQFKPVNIAEIWKAVSSDLEGLTQLQSIIRSLHMADRIMLTEHGILIKKEVFNARSSDMIDYSFLTTEEKEYLI